MKTSLFTHARGGRSGFTIIELLVGLVVGLIVLSSVVEMLVVQGRGYRKQREIIDIRETAREATGLLTGDLRQSAAGGSLLTVMAPNTIALRSPRGVGTICAKHPLLARYGLWKTGGNILAGIDDSALVYQVGREQWTHRASPTWPNDVIRLVSAYGSSPITNMRRTSGASKRSWPV